MLTITAAAWEAIHKELRPSEIPSPVVYLVQVSNTPPALVDAIDRGASRKEIRAIAAKVMDAEPRYLHPLIYPRSNFLWFFTSTIAGVRFASSFFYPRGARRAIKRGVLDAAERGLVLKDIDGTVVLPRPQPRAL